MKTVLAPNAPWPKWEEDKPTPPPKPKPKPKNKPPKKDQSKIERTDRNFEKWASKNLEFKL
jgi:hypothetical protein